MNERALTLKADLRVWQDERFGQLWRVAYRDGDEVTIVSFPDSEALGDFIAEQFGVGLDDSEPLVAAA
ncbi:MAG: hypothetical protein OHK0015_33070 [Chloroflexi bacterium OHK40]